MSEHPRVLIVDDEKDVRWALCTLMRDQGMTALEAQNGREALGSIRAECPDVVLLDIRLPDVDGMQVLKEVRRSDLTTPVIMLTAYGTIELAVEAVKSGAYDFLSKPFNNDEVVLTIRRALKERVLTDGVGHPQAVPDTAHPL